MEGLLNEYVSLVYNLLLIGKLSFHSSCCCVTENESIDVTANKCKRWKMWFSQRSFIGRVGFGSTVVTGPDVAFDPNLAFLELVI